MAAVTLVYNATPTRLGSLEVDCTVSEAHQADVDVTENPVEDSSAISDHLRPKPETVTIEGFITGTPIPETSTSRTVEHTTPDGRKISLITSVPEDIANGAITRIEQARDTLYRMKDAGELITVVTGLKTYDDMALRSLTINRTAKTGVSLPFTATFVQVKTVELRTTGRLTDASRIGSTSAKPHQKDGKQPTAEYKSVLLQAGEAGVDSFHEVIPALQRNLGR